MRVQHYADPSRMTLNIPVLPNGKGEEEKTRITNKAFRNPVRPCSTYRDG